MPFYISDPKQFFTVEQYFSENDAELVLTDLLITFLCVCREQREVCKIYIVKMRTLFSRDSYITATAASLATKDRRHLMANFSWSGPSLKDKLR